MEVGSEADTDERGPERTCIVSRVRGSPGTMLRFVVGPDGSVVPDLRARLPGRGAWVTATAAVVGQAVKRRAFARAFRRELAVEPGLADTVEALLRRDALAALGFANKAGLVLAGAFKIEDGLGRGPVVALLHATDGSPDGVRKMDAAARRRQPETSSLQIFTSGQMDLALGRSNVIHAALRAGGASEAFLLKAARWRRYWGETSETGIGSQADPVGSPAAEPVPSPSAENEADRRDPPIHE